MKTKKTFLFLLVTGFTYFFAFAGAFLGQVVSNFNSNNEGWTTFDGQTGANIPASYSATGGNPASGGYIFYYTGYTGGYTNIYFQAPPKFLGNQSFAYNQNLTFDLYVSAAGTDNSNDDIIIFSPYGNLCYQLPTKPAASVWTSYSITLNESQWHLGSRLGPSATREQMKQVLSSISNFRIRLMYLSGAGAVYQSQLDNVVINYAPIPTPPTISSFVPTSGLPGTAVTITGTNFGPTPAQNVVYFNGTKAVITSASTTKLTVTSPAKITYGPITVVNTSTGAQATTGSNYNPLFSNNQDFGGRVIASSFGKYTAFGTAPSASVGTTGFSVGDLDGDGWQDVLTSRNDAGNFYAQIFLNAKQAGSVNATSFAPAFTLTLPNSPTAGAVLRVGQTSIADMDNDGKLDVVVNVGYNLGGNWDNSFIIFLNQSTPGNLSFAGGYVFQIATVQNNNEGMTVADIDGDGRPDILHAWQNSGCQLGIIQNLSTPGNLDFSYSQNFWQGVTMGSDISVGDLNGDNKPEVLVEAYLGGAINVYENLSTPGSLSLGFPFQISTIQASNMKVADLDRDGKNDIFFEGSGTPNLYIKKNNHTTGALTAADFAPDIILTQQIGGSGGGSYKYTTAADVNGDNIVDLIMGDGANVAVYQNNYTSGPLSANSFYLGTTFTGSSSYYNQYVLCADIDGDNKPEILIRPQTGAGFWVFHNECFPVPAITSTSPVSAFANSSIALNGNLMYTGNTTPLVRLNKILAPLAGVATNTLTTVTSPLGEISGKFNINNHGLTSFSPFFTQTFNTNRIINSSSFGPSVDFALTSPLDVVGTADFNDDGKIDVYISDSGTGIFQNSTSPGQNITTSSLTKWGTTFSGGGNTVAFDIDGDGKADFDTGYLIVQNNSSAGTLSFAGSGSYAPPSGGGMAVSDFNKDGKLDMATIPGGANMYIFENLSVRGPFQYTGGPGDPFASTPTGLFNPTSSTSFGPGNNSIIAADFDGDGYDDVAGIVQMANNFAWFRNLAMSGPITGSSFSAGTAVPTSSKPQGITTADFDGDGKPDIAVVHSNSTDVSVFLNTSTAGSISFAAPFILTNPLLSGYNIGAQDLDGDGKPEIVTTVTGTNSFNIFQNKSTSGSLSFSTAITYNLPRKPQALAFADINADQKPDILMVGSGGSVTPASALMVFQNNIFVPTITIGTQPVGGLVVCSGTPTQFTVAASGTTNIAYQWQYSADGIAPYADISNSGGYTNVATATLSVNTTGNFGAGFYRCRVNGDFAAQVISNVASVSLKACSAPVINTQPLDTQVGGKITLNLVPLVATPGSTLDTASLQITVPPSSGAKGTISNGVLIIDYTGISFTGKENITIRACGSNGLCTTQQFSIDVAGDIVVFNGVSPNGNNPILYLQYIDLIPDAKANTVQIFDRWENMVWHGSNYDNNNVVFKGSGDNGNDLPTGVYFYRIDFASGRKTKTGFISLKR
ncbi:MAG: VCBS repeat-containing protein [Bacteroidetes bacterium]|nr:VCBS repeat-containing protein [Bacteroidota bacterium]